MRKMKILFVCKYNRFRSKVAEFIFNKLNKNKDIKTESAGLTLDLQRPFIESNVLDIVNKLGYKIQNSLPKQIDFKKINQYNLIIIVADNVQKSDFSSFKGQIIQFKIPDCKASEIDKIKEIVVSIEKELKMLINNL